MRGETAFDATKEKQSKPLHTIEGKWAWNTDQILGSKQASKVNFLYECIRNISIDNYQTNVIYQI